jgi:hypothetical protein
MREESGDEQECEDVIVVNLSNLAKDSTESGN